MCLGKLVVSDQYGRELQQSGVVRLMVGSSFTVTLELVRADDATENVAGMFHTFF